MILWDIFFMFLKIGSIGFGGGYAMLSMIFSEGQKTLGLTTEVFSQLMALDLIAPGPIALNASTFIGYMYGGVLGATLGTVAVMLPSIVYVEVIYHFMVKFKESKFLQGLLNGIIPATITLILYAAYTISVDGILINGQVSYIGIGIFIVSLIAMIKYKVDPIVVTIIAAIIGALLAL